MPFPRLWCAPPAISWKYFFPEDLDHDDHGPPDCIRGYIRARHVPIVFKKEDFIPNGDPIWDFKIYGTVTRKYEDGDRTADAKYEVIVYRAHVIAEDWRALFPENFITPTSAQAVETPAKRFGNPELAVIPGYIEGERVYFQLEDFVPARRTTQLPTFCIKGCLYEEDNEYAIVVYHAQVWRECKNGRSLWDALCSKTQVLYWHDTPRLHA